VCHFHEVKVFFPNRRELVVPAFSYPTDLANFTGSISFFLRRLGHYADGHSSITFWLRRELEQSPLAEMDDAANASIGHDIEIQLCGG